MQSLKQVHIDKYAADAMQHYVPDQIVIESPLQIMISYGNMDNRTTEALSVTMRTPGDDINLATGFLFNEGIIEKADEILSVKHTADENTLLAELSSGVEFNSDQNKRNFTATSACGYCGKAIGNSLNANQFSKINTNFRVDAELLYKLPALLQARQTLFSETGGTHAVALVDQHGILLEMKEDVGRHNAMDKLTGSLFQKNALPLQHQILLFSGRLSYELVQKSAMAGTPVICAIGAPTSLAIELAQKNNITVVGFLKRNGFNIYCGAEKIIPS